MEQLQIGQQSNYNKIYISASHRVSHGAAQAILQGSCTSADWKAYQCSVRSNSLPQGPNPWKVVIIIEELQLPYQLVLEGDVKGKAFLAINPNGRVPALEDPNTNLTLWEVR